MLINDTHLIWIDLEMTGLNPNQDRILEIATVVTTSDLDIVAEGPALAIYQTELALNQMDAWNQSHHTESGLIERVKSSSCTEAEAETQTITFLSQYVPPRASPMCGNSICQDRRFLARYMPELEQYFHYRQVDVSTLKILAQRWAPQVAARVKKTSTHMALQDIHDSIEELRYYREHLLKY